MYAFSEKYILAFSHDEVVHGKASMLGKMYGLYDDKFSALRALFGYQFAHPGKKLNFMGSEFGQFIEWDYKKQLDWFLLDYPAHNGMKKWCAALGHLYLQEPALWQIEDSWEGFTWLNPDDNDRSSIAFMRWPRSGGTPIVVVCNFTPMTWEDFVIGLPAAGKLVPLLTSDAKKFGGQGHPFRQIKTKKGDFREFGHTAAIHLPPLSTQYFYFKEEESHGPGVKEA